MAYNDTLFQLGMDLTRSSPAQEEDSIDQVQVLHGDRIEDGVCVHSSHLIIDLSGAKAIGSGKSVECALGEALAFVKANVQSIGVRRANQRGWMTGSAVLSDGHVTIHACPAKGLVAVDIVSRSDIRPDVAMTGFADAFAAREVTLKKQRSEAELARMRAPVVQLSGVSKRKASQIGAGKALRAKAA
ncbi:MAG: S-adenosylmethionine decarboxylase [Hyphomicrobium sp.]